MFWLMLLTSKSWGNGTGLGRIVGPLLMADITWIGIMIYKVHYKGEPWSNNYFFSMLYMHGAILLMLFFLLIYSIFKERMHREFWTLAKQTLRRKK